MTRTLIIILTSLMLVGCAKGPQHWVYVENIYAREMAQYQNIQNAYFDLNIQKAFYHTFTTDLNQLEKLKVDTLEKCKKDWRSKFILGFENLDEGCVYSEGGDEIKNSKKFKDFITKLQNDKNKKEEAIKQVKRDEELKIKREKIARVELAYSGKCKKFKQGTPEYENCLFENEKLALDEQKRLATLPSAERYAYTCEKTYGFKKGSDNFRDCVFKIMTTEYEMQRASDQRRITELESKINNNSSNYNSELLEIERLKAKALQDQADAVRNRNQTDALMDLSRSLLNNNNRAPANAPNLPLNCRSVRVGNTVQTQCY